MFFALGFSTLLQLIFLFISEPSGICAAWFPAIMNSSEEVSTVGNLVQQNSDWSGVAGIGGSTNQAAPNEFAFSPAYIQNSSTG